MNRIQAQVTAIKSEQNITIVTFYAAEEVMRMMALELDSEIAVGTKVVLGVKATSITLAKGLMGEVSSSNQLEVYVDRIITGALLCSVRFTFAGVSLESVITKASAERMLLKEGDAVTALVKSSDLSILEVVPWT